jgi:hypothetical protein
MATRLKLSSRRRNWFFLLSLNVRMAAKNLLTHDVLVDGKGELVMAPIAKQEAIRRGDATDTSSAPVPDLMSSNPDKS